MTAATTHTISAIRAGREARAKRKEEIDRERIEANSAFAQTIKAARDNGVPWKDIVEAAGMSRQMLNELLRDHCS